MIMFILCVCLIVWFECFVYCKVVWLFIIVYNLLGESERLWVFIGEY